MIHEQEIGEAIFGRPRSYDTNVDNIVRVNATGLRKRLENYFTNEGAQEELILEIPRGSYTPVFRRRSVPAPPVEAAVLPPPSPMSTMPLAVSAATSSGASGPGLISKAVWPALAGLLLLLCLALLWQDRTLDHQLQVWHAEPSLRAFWSEFFTAGRETDIVLADTSFSVAEDMLQRNISLSDYIDYNYKRFAEAPELSPAQRHDLGLVLERNNGSIGDFRVAQQLLALNADPKRSTLKFSREYTIDEAKRNNLILIGSQTSNPWVGLFADRLNFALQYDPAKGRPFVTNRAPQPGEQPLYTTPELLQPANSRSSGTGYGVIAYLPALNGKGRVLLLEGTDSQATAATGEFVTNADSMAAFESRFPSGQLPFFEILLRTSQISGTPLHAEIAAFRIYPDKTR